MCMCARVWLCMYVPVQIKSSVDWCAWPWSNISCTTPCMSTGSKAMAGLKVRGTRSFHVWVWSNHMERFHRSNQIKSIQFTFFCHNNHDMMCIYIYIYIFIDIICVCVYVCIYIYIICVYIIWQNLWNCLAAIWFPSTSSTAWFSMSKKRAADGCVDAHWSHTIVLSLSHQNPTAPRTRTSGSSFANAARFAWHFIEAWWFQPWTCLFSLGFRCF